MKAKSAAFVAFLAVTAAGQVMPYTFEGTWSGLALPSAVAYSASGKVYVADNHHIKYFTPSGSLLGSWGTYGTGNSQFRYPNGVTVTDAGRVYVADTANNRVQYFTSSGSFLGKWGTWGSGNGEFDSPGDVSVSPDGRVYVADTGSWTGILTCRIQYFTSKGNFLGKWGQPGTVNGRFNFPTGVYYAPNDRVYVADAGNYRVQYFTRDGSFLGKWGSRGTGNGQFLSLHKVVCGPYNRVFVSDWKRDEVRYFDQNGVFAGKIGGSGTANGLFNDPLGLAVSYTGVRLYVCDNKNDRIQYFNRNAPAVEPTSLGRVKALFH